MKEFVKPFVGQKIDLGYILFSEQEIIDFAKAFDPLEFHIDKKVAEKTIFKGLIASGPHPFNYVYRTRWLPLYGKTIICGMGISNWKFIKPVYPNQKIFVEATVVELAPDPHIGGTAITWQFDFKNEKGEMVQTLCTEILHKL